MTATQDELFKVIRHVQMVSSQLSDDLFAGAYRSAFKGRGMEFEEVREYQPGDEIRTIDWNVTARMNHPYVKTFREERDLTVFLAVDISGSTLFGGQAAIKRNVIAEIAAILAFSAIKNNDRIGVSLFSDRVEKFITPKKGVRHVLRIIRELLTYQPKHPQTNLENVLSFLGSLPKRGICFLISDFMSDLCEHELAIIARKHDLIAISVTDDLEHHFPDLGLINIGDLENSQTILADTSSKGFSEAFSKAAFDKMSTLKRVSNQLGMGLIQIRTSEPYLPPLRKFFKLRELRRR